MLRKIIFSALFVLFLAGSCCAADIKWLGAFKKEDRVLILAPHPDDEAIGCAGVIQQAVAQRAKVKIVCLTNGDHNQPAFSVYKKKPILLKSTFLNMGEVRRKEAIGAVKSLGAHKHNIVFLGYPDFGIFEIFSQYWNPKQPFSNLFTRTTSVPYKTSFSYGALYVGQSILQDLKRVILDYKPSKIFVSHPADVNGDHKALYLFLQVALLDLGDQIPEPKIYPYLIHCPGWPSPRDYHPELDLEPPGIFTGTEFEWKKLALSAKQINKKYDAIMHYRSQTASSAFYLLSFARRSELFGDCPTVEIKRQAALKEKAMSFFGFSEMYMDPGSATLDDAENYIGKEGSVSYAVVNGDLLVRIEKPKELDHRFSAELYLFGYSRKAAFKDMPKIFITVQHKNCRVFNAKNLIEESGVTVSLKENACVLRVPLKTLNDPQVIFSSVKTFGDKLPVDTVAFRRIEIKNGT